MAGTRLRSTQLRTVDDRWWRSQWLRTRALLSRTVHGRSKDFWILVLWLLFNVFIVVAAILGVGGGASN
jgi:hypothetical protein